MTRFPARMTLAAVIVAGALLIWLSSDQGIWYAPLVVGAAWGWFGARSWRALGGAWLTWALGWGLALIQFAATAPLAEAARVVAEIMGFGAVPLLPLVLTAIFGLLEATAGAWLGLAARGIMNPRHGVPTAR
jgi:hypothetical protein